jgi:serine/threonine-protein kinase
MNGDRDLLLGELAQQLEFLEPESLAACLHAWQRDRTKPLGEMLRDQGRLTVGQLKALELVVEEHLLACQGDPQRSRAAAAASTEAKSSSDLLRETAAEPPGTGMQSTSPVSDPHATTGFAGMSAPGEPARNGRMRYRILRPHAQGGLGEVFVALDEELNREVALKEIQARHADVAPSRQRFVLEAEITGGLEHPGIVPVYGLGAHPDGRPYYAMRFIRGEDLKAAIARFHGGTRGQGDKERGGRFGPLVSSSPYPLVRFRASPVVAPFHRRLQRRGLCPQPRRDSPRP